MTNPPPPWGSDPDDTQPYRPTGDDLPPPGPPADVPPPPGPAPQQPSPPPTEQYPVYQPYGASAGQPNAYGVGVGVPYQAPNPTNGMAIGAMVTSLVGLAGCFCYGLGGIIGLVGAILGHVSLRQIKRTSAGGRGMALTGVIVGWIVFALAIIGWIALGIIIANEWDTSCPATDDDYPFCSTP